jgi:predicted nucleotidyltransferase
MPIVKEVQQPTKEFVIQELQCVFSNLLALYAFGSRTQGTASEQSDLDLAVLVEGYADPIQLFEMANQLADQLGYEVDLLDMRAASTVMQYQILTKGERWWVKDALQVGLFETMVLSEKTNLDEARAGLLADIQARGNVYG